MEPRQHVSARRTPPAPPLTRLMPKPLTAVMERGQALERHGQREDARRMYEQALGDESLGADSVAQLHRWIARTYMQDSHYSAANDAARTALSVSNAAQ